MDPSQSTNTNSSCRKDVSANSIYRKQVTAAALDSNMSAASTETLGRIQDQTNAIASGSRTETRFHSKPHNQAPRLLTWLWNDDRPWEAFKPHNSPNYNTVQGNTENDSASGTIRKVTTASQEQAAGRR